MYKHINTLVNSLKQDDSYTHFVFWNHDPEVHIGPWLRYPKADVFYSNEVTMVILHGVVQKQGKLFLSVKAFYPESDSRGVHWKGLRHYLDCEAGLHTATCEGAKFLSRLIKSGE